MKAIVLEKRDGESAVLREDGVVVRTRTAAAVGETIEISKAGAGTRPQAAKRHRRAILRIAAMAAAALLAFTGVGAYQYTTVQAAGCVSMDDGDGLSVDYVMNRRGQVIEIDAYGSQAREIAQFIRQDGFHRCPLEKAIDTASRAKASINAAGEGDASASDGQTDAAGAGETPASETRAGSDSSGSQDPSDASGIQTGSTSGSAITFSVTAPNERQQKNLTAEVEKWIDAHFPSAGETDRPEILEGSMEDHKKALEEGMGTASYLLEQREEERRQETQGQVPGENGGDQDSHESNAPQEGAFGGEGSGNGNPGENPGGHVDRPNDIDGGGESKDAGQGADGAFPDGNAGDAHIGDSDGQSGNGNGGKDADDGGNGKADSTDRSNGDALPGGNGQAPADGMDTVDDIGSNGNAGDKNSRDGADSPSGVSAGQPDRAEVVSDGGNGSGTGGSEALPGGSAQTWDADGQGSRSGNERNENNGAMDAGMGNGGGSGAGPSGSRAEGAGGPGNH